MRGPNGHLTPKIPYIRTALAAAIMLGGMFVLFGVPAAQAQSTVNVTINNFSFTPGTITVVIGINNTVTWTNQQSGVPYHTVTPDTGDPVMSWGSGELTNGQSYTFTFSVAGTYGYHCSLHTYMKGMVVVLNASPSSSSTIPTSTTSSVTTQSSSLSSTTSTPTAAVPEFPFGTVVVVVIMALVVASYIAVRQTKRSSI